VRLRSILTRPDSTIAQGERLPALLLLQDATGGSVEGGGYNPYRELASAFTERGYAVMRWDRRGTGDSEGEPAYSVDFETEVRDAAAALDFLKRQPDVDTRAIYVLGVGTGGIIAASLGREPGLAGVLLAGAIGRPWSEFVADATWRSALFSGASESDAARAREATAAFYDRLGRGEHVETILAQHPEWGPHVLDPAGRPFGRNGAFLKQLLSVELDALYREVRCPVAVVLGSADPFSIQADADRILEALALRENNDARLVVLPSTDRDFAHAEDAKASTENWMTGELAFNADVVERLLGWFHRADESLRAK
jgi:pimeloyl-ACP methyl ester carboxylesterase